MKRGFVPIWLFSWLLFTQPAWSGLDIDEYLPPQQSDLSPEEQAERRAKVQRQVEQARQREAERARQAEAARRAEEERLAARPFPVRLTEKRCLTCHVASNLQDNPQTRLGWEITILRMSWFQGAELEAGDRKVIAEHLAKMYPAPAFRRYLEYLLLALALFLPLFVIKRAFKHQAKK